MVVEEVRKVTKGIICIEPDERKALNAASVILDKMLALIEDNIGGDIDDTKITNSGAIWQITGEELDHIEALLNRISNVTYIKFEDGKE